ncbi:MAG: hypothetical protein QOE71_3809 [Pseudonocardiales bacterium]|nr:hypothetical protein [Pseudonocardiales bacterium]
MDAIITATTTSAKTVAATHVGGPGRSQRVPGTKRAAPVLAFPEAAANALGLACHHGQIRSEPRALPARPSGIERLSGSRQNRRRRRTQDRRRGSAPQYLRQGTPLLDGYRDRTPVSRQALRSVLLRLAALVEDLPEVVELDLNPVVCRCEDLLVVDAKIRVGQASLAPDPALRRLRG